MNIELDKISQFSTGFCPLRPKPDSHGTPLIELPEDADLFNCYHTTAISGMGKETPVTICAPLESEGWTVNVGGDFETFAPTKTEALRLAEEFLLLI